MPDQTPAEKPRMEIDWVKIVAGALAAVSSAVILSTLGAAGTIIGAAVGSVVVSLSSSLYSTGLSRSRERVAEAQARALQRVGVAQAEVRRASRRRASQTAVDGHLAHAEEQLIEAQVQLDELSGEDHERVSWKQWLAALPWKRIVLLTVGLFVIAIVAITVFELLAGRPVSSFTGGSKDSSGTSFSDLGGGAKKNSKPAPSHRPTRGSTPTSLPTPQPTPTQGPTQGSSSTPTPTPSGTPTPSAPGTGVPTPNDTPTAGPS
jgi:hypothetical protein